MLSSSSPSKKKRKSKRKKQPIKQASSSSSSSESSSEEDEAEEAVAHNAKAEAQVQPSQEPEDNSASVPRAHDNQTNQPPAQSLPVATPQASSLPAAAAAPAVLPPPTPASTSIPAEGQQPHVYSMFQTHILNSHKSLIFKDPLKEEDYNALIVWLTQTVLSCVKGCHIDDARAVEQIAKHTLNTQIWQINMARQEGPHIFSPLNRQRSDNMLRSVTQNVVALAMYNAECSTFRSISKSVRVICKAHLLVESSFQPDNNGVHDLRKITDQIVSVLKSEEFVNYLCEVAYQAQLRFPVCEQLTRRMFDDWRRTNKAPDPLKEMTKHIVQKATSRYICNMVEKVMS